MRFSLIAATLLVAFNAAVGQQVVVSPTPGQVIPLSQPFNLTYDSGRFFEENSVKIDVVISPADGSFPGSAPVEDLLPTSRSPADSSAIYSVLVDGNTRNLGPATGNHTVYIIEKYVAFGGLPSIDVFSVPVVFV
ncbi:hypothetical protein C8R44DRAFT_958248 [Mycena epipterygia]|nr:hypothetical protein C8R44DRAFT_958248 [Mycena epipterygia]